jgi:hypothetical protein
MSHTLVHNTLQLFAHPFKSHSRPSNKNTDTTSRFVARTLRVRTSLALRDSLSKMATNAASYNPSMSIHLPSTTDSLTNLELAKRPVPSAGNHRPYQMTPKSQFEMQQPLGSNATLPIPRTPASTGRNRRSRAKKNVSESCRQLCYSDIALCLNLFVNGCQWSVSARS